MQEFDLTMELTDDGSATLFIPQLNEHYHSVKGALTESNHIYRDCAFLHRCSTMTTNEDILPYRLLEIGFGTGLNACVTAMVATESCPVHYISLEKYPVDNQVLECLHYESLVDATLWKAIHDAPWGEATHITPYFVIEKRVADYLVDPLPDGIDVVYFDAFAPEKQPEMWTSDAFRRLVSVMNHNALLTTYCAKGEIRRLLTVLGLKVERIAGPIGGKREILRATLS
ncbi:MAG: tRNA (5-methylaminomethyl-2-thiouridine)(34)-methyltransferase MnmD [Bacteroidaceae bacterium]|nr:tRNA (5-methylaminomethyl-2-thiouridine)(34)-methyltransferase MnmD [Bacteroidaceae bacterium]